MAAYQLCAERFARRYAWIFQFDLDEFAVVTDAALAGRPAPLKALMRDFRFHPGLWLQWRIFGPGDLQHRPAVGGPLAHYTKCILRKPVNMYGKSLASRFWFRAVSSAHADYYRCGVESQENAMKGERRGPMAPIHFLPDDAIPQGRRHARDGRFGTHATGHGRVVAAAVARSVQDAARARARS